ncbi:unnamed protein product [Microthlaspi erraticum]|uniref:Uncharacterized protein n=1 Tax=Microthlaspi erraticum TaxID=1685480 RepID=A0A6D2HBK0_9BRAS|nr:unnamed protein product [Microthlaspi erraticum]
MGFGCEAVSNLNTQEALALPEKEVIQPHLPVRLPCYDFTPVTSPAFGTPLLAVKASCSLQSELRTGFGVSSSQRAQPSCLVATVEFGTLNRLPVISRRKVRMTSSHHAPYALGDTRATMAGTKGRDPARVS